MNRAVMSAAAFGLVGAIAYAFAIKIAAPAKSS